MKGTVLAHTHARLSGSVLRFVEGPNAVIAALVLSTCVTAASSYIVVSKAMPHIGASPTADDAGGQIAVLAERRPVPRRLPVEDLTPGIGGLGFADATPARLAPADLQAGDETDRVAPSLPAPIRVIAGRPPVLPAPRPSLGLPETAAPASDTIIQLARGLSPDEALGLPSPSARPDGVNAEAPRQVAAAVSPRPSARPVTLSSRTPAPEDAQIVLAAATTPEVLRPEPRLSDPDRPTRTASNCGSRRIHDMPRRPGGAAGGSAVMASVGNGSGSSRDNALVREAMRGNMPSYMRDLQPVTFNGVVGGRQTQITICVTPDYLSIGSDSDNVRVPLGLPAALRVADAFDMMLPTTRMVDAIYAQADVRLSPRPMTPGSQMSSTNYFVQHDQTLDQQLRNAGGRGGILVAGHKKDLVLANRLARAPGRVAIYGWHRGNGNPIQPLSTVHGEYYADYSHGIRLVSRIAFVNGRQVDLRDLLTSGTYAGLLNSDGPLSSSTVRLASLQ